MSNEDDFTEAFRRGLKAAAKKYGKGRMGDGDPIYDVEQKPMRPYAVMSFAGMKLWSTVADARPRDHVEKPRPLSEPEMRRELARFKTGAGAPINVRFGFAGGCDCGRMFCPAGDQPTLKLTMDIADPISGNKTDATNTVRIPETARRDVGAFRSWVIMRVKWLWLHECNEFLFFDDRLATNPHPEQPWYAEERARRERPSGSVTFTLMEVDKAKGADLDTMAYMYGMQRPAMSSVEFREVMGPREEKRDRNGKRTPGYVDRLPRPTHKDKFTRRR